MANGFEDIEAIGTIDILRRGGVDVKTVSITGSNTVESAHSISIEADMMIEDGDFSDADALVLPYRTATQSGVTQIAYNFSVPMIVTRVGGLPEIVLDGRVGYVCEPNVEGIADAIVRLYREDSLNKFAENFPAERKRFSWATMCDKLIEVYNQTK